MMDASCPCGSQRSYLDCCSLFLSKKAHATTPEQLMRSRYTAFSRGIIDYLIATRHPSKRKHSDRAALMATVQEIQWLRLQILNADPVPEQATKGSVEFVAFYHKRNQENLHPQSVEQLHEKSQFIREKGLWFYWDGEIKKT